MKRSLLWIMVLCLFGLSMSAVVLAGEAAKTGIVKGSISIGGRPTSDVVVSVEGLSPDVIESQMSQIKPDRAILDQRELKFIPRVLPVLMGTTVDFPNNDKSWHNIYSASSAKKFDLGLYAPGKTRSILFEKPGVVRILCNVHPSMEAYIVVKEHPYFAAPDKDGNYRLDQVPLGKQRIQVWHPQFGTRAVSVHVVREGEVLVIDFDLKKK